MIQYITRLIRLLNERLKLFLSVSFGTFLFILFFEPFPIERFDFNNLLLFIAGYGAIIFLIFSLAWVIFPRVSSNDLQNEPVTTPYLTDFVILIAISTAFAFYLRYVGSVQISFYIIFKVVLIGFATLAIIRVYETNQELRRQNELLTIEKKIVEKQVKKYEDDDQNKSIEFISENNSENLVLHINEIVFLKSADNYVEIAFTEGDHIKKKLIRNTLKNIEVQIKPYPNFIRCHRICIVNLHFIEKLNRNENSHWLSLRGYQEQIPVSRQYLLKLKDTLLG